MKTFIGMCHLMAGLAIAVSGQTMSAQSFPGQTADPEGWKTVWYDHFDGTTLDSSVWNIETNSNGGGNNELQHYGPEGVSLRDGNLVLTARRQAADGKAFTSGRINSRGKVFFTHGKIEARIKMPKTAKGLWPAFWMLGENIGTNPWPMCGEIDIVEMGNVDGWNNGNDPERYMNGACHWGYYENGYYPNYAKAGNAPHSVQDGNYHTFTCVWDDKTISMYLDNSSEAYYVINVDDYSDSKSVGNYFHKPFHILFNLAVGGVFPAIYDPDGITASIPAEMLVDWVRVSQPEDDLYTFNVPFVDDDDDEEYGEDPATNPGKWGTRALDDNGNYTFDFSTADDFVLIGSSNGLKEMLQGRGKRITDYNVDEANNFFYIWPDGTSYNPGAAKGVNSFGLNEQYTSLTVGTLGWSGAGYSSPENGKDLSMLNDDYILHFAMKGSDLKAHASHEITVGNVKFTIGFGGSSAVLGDYPRDGRWYNFDIPLKVLKELGNPLFGTADDPVASFKGNVVAFSSGAVPGTKLQVDNIFFYKDPTKTDVSTDDNTPCGKYMSKAVVSGQSTFDFENADKVIPLLISDGVRQRLAGKIRDGYDTSDSNPRFDIWDGTMVDAHGTGRNSFGLEEKFTSIAVKAGTTWSGGGINITTPDGIDFSVLSKEENYYFHLGIRDAESIARFPYSFKINGKQLTLGGSGNGYVTDFTRDGEWYYLDIPLSEIDPNLFNSLIDDKNILTYDCGSREGTKLEIDNLFFYVNLNPGKPVDPVDPDVPQADNLNKVPVPAHDAVKHKVLSIYSSDYDQANPFIIGSWGQSTQAEEVTLKGTDGKDKKVYKLSDFNYLGWELQGDDPDLSTLTHMHVDYYTPDGNSFSFTPIARDRKVNDYTGETHYIPTVKKGEWNSYDAPLSHFTNEYVVASSERNMAAAQTGTVKKIYQIKFDRGGNSEGYIANVYFYNADENGEEPGVTEPENPGNTGDGCTTTGTEAFEGEFKGDYTVTCKTLENGTDVEITASFAGDYIGLDGPWMHNVTNGFTETRMTDAGNGKYTETVSGLKKDDVIKFRIKIAYAGGLGVTKNIEYTVGNNCGGIDTGIRIEDSIEKTTVYPNPSDDVWNVSCPETFGEITIWSLDGKLGGRYELVDGSAVIDAKPYAKGMYMMHIATYNGTRTIKVVRK